MNIPEPGQPFPNYKAVCQYVGEPILAGKQKELQLKRWKQHFTWTRNGNAWLILEHKDFLYHPQRNSRWSKHLDLHVCLLAYSAFKQFGLPSNLPTRLQIKDLVLFTLDAMVQLGLCNAAYSKLRENELPFPEEDQQSFYDLSFPRLYSIMMDSFKRLSENGTLVYARTYLGVAKAETRLVTEEERVVIETHKAFLLRKYQKKNEFAVMRSIYRFRFYEDLELLVSTDKELGFSKVFGVHRFYFTDDSLAELPQYIEGIKKLRLQLKESTNEESKKLHLQLFSQPPFTTIANLVIPTINKEPLNAPCSS